MEPEFVLNYPRKGPDESSEPNAATELLTAIFQRPEIADMTDREMLAEMLTIMRGIGDVANEIMPQVQPVIETLTKNPMFKALGRMG